MSYRTVSKLGWLVAPLTTLALAVPGLAEDTIETKHHELTVETIAENIEHPWGLALLPDGRFLVTERNAGQLRLGSTDGQLSEPLQGVPEIFRYKGETGRSQAGLFDVKLHPEFDENQLVYLSFSKPTERGAALAIVRGRLSEDGTRLENVEDVFEMKEDDQSSDGLHFGGRMAFDAENEALFLTIGDRRNISRAQDVADQAGSILRMSWDGGPMGGDVRGPAREVAGDNEENKQEPDPYLWSWGHRNPQGLALNPEDGQLWLADHGPKGGDEINRVEEGRNYGWPHHTEGVDYSGAPIGHQEPPEDIVEPLHVFQETVAPSGLAFYRGAAFPEWEDHLLVGGLVTEGLVRLAIDSDGQVTDEEKIELERRVRDVQVAADGSIWLITEHSDGEVLRLTAAR